MAVQVVAVGPGRLGIREIELPSPQRDEVLVRVVAAGVNPADVKSIAGLPPSAFPVPMGFEAAGVVEAVGPDVAPAGGPAVGDEVIAYLVRGGYASHLLVRAAEVVPKPTALTFPQAANLLLVGTTAAQMLHLAGVGDGDTVVVHGASGATGVSVLQQAALLGARTIGTAGPGSFETVRRFGGEPVEYGPGLLSRVRAQAPEGVDAALDCVGTEEAVSVSLELVPDRSRIVTIAASGLARAAGFTGLTGGEPESMRYRMGERRRITALAEDGRLAVPVVREFPLEEVDIALELVMSGHPGGKIALLPKRT